MKTKILERLENLLAHWESHCEARHIVAELQKVLPYGNQFKTFLIDEPVIHARTLRRFILDTKNACLDTERYVYGKNPEFTKGWISSLTTFPIFLFKWCRNSRRAYSLSSELTDLLLMTKVDDVLWDDIQFPFPTFVIDLEEGFTDRVKGVHKFILVDHTREDSVNRLVLTSFGTVDAELFPIVNQRKFAEIREKIRHRAYEKAGHMTRVIYDEMNSEVSGFEAPFEIKDGWTVAQSIQQHKDRDTRDTKNLDYPLEFYENLTEIESNILRIVIGLILYLKTLPPQSPNMSDWQDQHTSKKDSHSVTNGATVCTVTSSVKLSAEDRKVLREQIIARGKGYEVRAHFREGHWRRPPGKGDDPTALKTVWVKPCLVRGDRLKDGEIPIGLEQKIQ